MTPPPCQRWTERRARYRPAGERIDPARHTVAEMEHAPARAFTERHHYSGTWSSVSRAWGLYRDRGPVCPPSPTLVVPRLTTHTRRPYADHIRV